MAIGAILGGVGGLMSGIGSIGSMFGLGGQGETPGQGRLTNIQDASKYGSKLPYATAQGVWDAWRYGQLPVPLQRSLQALQPLTQMQYAGTTDQLAMGATAAREDVARRYGERGVTGPQMTADLQRIDDTMRLGDMAARRQASQGYANAVSAAYSDIYGRAFSEPRSWFGLGVGGGDVGGGVNPWQAAAAAGQGLTQVGRNVMDFQGSGVPGVPDYAGDIGNQFGGWSPTPGSGGYGNFPQPGPPRLMGGGPYDIPGINPP